MISDLLTFYALSFLMAAGSLFVLWQRREARHDHLRKALVGLLIISLVGGVAAYAQPPGAAMYLLLLQLIAWGVFLWGLEIAWRFWGLILLVLGILGFWPALPGWEILSWGLLTAVPLSTFVTLRQTTPTAIPIFAPTKAAPYQQPAYVSGSVSPQTLQSQQPILECLADGIVFSGVDGTITYVNQAAAAIIGQETSTLVGHPVTDILTHLPMLATTTPNTPQDPVTQRLERDNFEINGRIIQGRMTIIYSHTGVAQGTVAILRDVTTEQQAKRSREGFLATVSHELRTPLTAIKGYTELLDSGAGGPLTDLQKTFTRPIQRNVTRMIQLINSLLFAAAVKGGQMAFTSDHTSVPQIVHQITRELLPKAAANGQRFTIQLDERLNVIQADPMHVATILEELLANAIKYNIQGGEIRIRSSLQWDEGRQQEFAVISVQDEGLGIQPEDQARIFEDFFHPDRTDAQVRAGGMGMGLSVVRALVEAYNGRVWLESLPGQGSTFYFLMPVQQPETMSFWPTP
jgi:PAS domain S-box-containing protein